MDREFIKEEILKHALHYSNPNNISLSKEDGTELSLVEGLPSLAIFFGQLSKFDPSGEWEIVERRYLNKIYEIVNNNSMDLLSLWNGLCGVAFSYVCSPNFNEYTEDHEHLQELIYEQIPIVWDQAMSNLEYSNVVMSDYDVILGLAGVSMYLLSSPRGESNSYFISLINRYFVKLINSSKLYNGHELPTWHITPKNLFHDIDREMYPDGYLNFSLSHGILGPFRILVHSLNNNIEVEGQKEAIDKVRKLFEQFSYRDELGMIWPKMIGTSEYIQGVIKNIPTRLDSWCYGEPSFIESLINFHKLDKDTSCDQLILDTVTGLIKSSLQLRNEDIGLCHGDAGILYQMNLLKNSISIEGLHEYCEKLSKNLIQNYKDNFTQLYLDHSLLNGKIGVFLVWISILSDKKDNIWHKGLLLS
ncbi:lanthionine synthetase C family protein [Paenibacillus sp. FSL R5-0701]